MLFRERVHIFDILFDILFPFLALPCLIYVRDKFRWEEIKNCTKNCFRIVLTKQKNWEFIPFDMENFFKNPTHCLGAGQGKSWKKHTHNINKHLWKSRKGWWVFQQKSGERSERIMYHYPELCSDLFVRRGGTIYNWHKILNRQLEQTTLNWVCSDSYPEETQKFTLFLDSVNLKYLSKINSESVWVITTMHPSARMAW